MNKEYMGGFMGCKHGIPTLARCSLCEDQERMRERVNNHQLSTSLPEGIKYDSDKIRPELIAPEFIESLSEVLTYGAKKYEDRNWEKGMKWSRPFGAVMRHLWAWWKGEEKDPETGFSHLAHAACCIMFLVTYEARKTGEDNRWKP